MRGWTIGILATLLLLTGAGIGLSQETTEGEQPQRTREERREAMRERIRRAMQLPRTTEEAREEGADEEEVQEVLRTGRERGVPAGDMQEILEEENRAMRDGRKDNFGAAVREMRSRGLRGRELAEAIHSEQATRGKKTSRRNGGPRGIRSESSDERPDRRRDYADETSRDDKSKGRNKAKGKGKGR